MSLERWIDGYYELGWSLLPLPPGRKASPPPGTTGDGAPDLSKTDLLAALAPGGNVGLRMPRGVVGIDVDAYGEKQGAETLFAVQAIHGTLPPSPRLTSRSDDPWSGIRFFRVPEGFELGTIGKDIDTIRRTWRYAVAAPSRHPEGRQYAWLDADGRPTRPPAVEELPDLPQAWIDAFPHEAAPTALRSSGRPATDLVELGRSWFRSLPAELSECASVAQAREEGLRAAARQGRTGTARNDLLKPVLKLVLQGDGGCPGVREAVEEVGRTYVGLPHGEDHAEKFWHLVGSTVDRIGEHDSWDCEHLSPQERALLPQIAGALGRPGSAQGVDHENPRGWLDWGREFWTMAKPPMLIPSVLAEGGVGLLYCGPGRGKSIICQDIAVGFTVRGTVFGVEVEPQAVVYVDHENSMSDIRDRIGAMGLTQADALSLRAHFHYSLLGDWPPLNTREGGDALIEEAQRLSARLVILDTNSKLIQGEENSNDVWQGMHSHTTKRLKRLGIAVLQLDHSGKDEDKGVRGGSAKTNNVDVVWKLWAASGDQPRVRTLTCEKDRPSAYGGVGSVVRLDVEYSPLQHVLSLGALPSAVASEMAKSTRIDAIVDALDSLGVNPSLNRDKVRPILRAGMPELKASNVDLGEAIKRRRPERAP